MLVVRQLRANVKTSNGSCSCYDTCVEDVHYDLPPAEGESDEEAKMLDAGRPIGIGRKQKSPEPLGTFTFFSF